ncbi:unannotated protein [freshwater metagenome]|uniref:Unannotated protein n=1 Tax=freshwater metagenome TaxID=449393 RepID=A0A6J6NKM8_9ZZZZ|nr:DoxX family membrane protein [Actinomycetota bacterium]MSW26106.1 DoxX family membrane protein [Actinomycetota bacterium]MSW33759.1 DoxX family membrane protein [Actinomycetota bacterium]MSX31551.1 DoxX family membrane protein [Actinomycetota bacterium]MSX51403.1 DoxX family membrane protein [Actinomycetota bacterium]
MKKYGPWIGLLSRLILGGVLAFAGYLKAFNPSKAKMAVRAYEVLPIPVANVFGIALPWLEIGAGLLLILGVAVRHTSIFAGALMLLFIAAISQAWARGLSIDCGCFGGGGQVDPKDTKYLPEIARDFGLLILSVYLFRYPRTRFALEKVG